MGRRLAAEFVGSALLAAVVIGSGIAAQQLSPGQTGLQLFENAAATAAGLFALILMVGPVSGAHFNPVVSFVDAAFGGLKWRQAAAYLPAQVAGCICGGIDISAESQGAYSMAAMAVRHAFTVSEWHIMGDAGLFGEDARVELLDGEVIEMAPIGSAHNGCVIKLTNLLVEAVGHRALISAQGPVRLDERSEPQPDLAVLSPREDAYRRSHPLPADILLLVEVADTSLDFDRGRKASYYAESGVREAWIVDLGGDQVLVMRSPSSSGYGQIRSMRGGDQLDIQALPGVAVNVDDVLGPK
jgi:Uma2 family endonuclease